MSLPNMPQILADIIEVNWDGCYDEHLYRIPRIKWVRKPFGGASVTISENVILLSKNFTSWPFKIQVGHVLHEVYHTIQHTRWGINLFQYAVSKSYRRMIEAPAEYENVRWAIRNGAVQNKALLSVKNAHNPVWAAAFEVSTESGGDSAYTESLFKNYIAQAEVDWEIWKENDLP